MSDKCRSLVERIVKVTLKPDDAKHFQAAFTFNDNTPDYIGISVGGHLSHIRLSDFHDMVRLIAIASSKATSKQKNKE